MSVSTFSVETNFTTYLLVKQPKNHVSLNFAICMIPISCQCYYELFYLFSLKLSLAYIQGNGAKSDAWNAFIAFVWAFSLPKICLTHFYSLMTLCFLHVLDPLIKILEEPKHVYCTFYEFRGALLLLIFSLCSTCCSL